MSLDSFLEFEKQLGNARPAAKPRGAFDIFSEDMARMNSTELSPAVLHVAWSALQPAEMMGYQNRSAQEFQLFQAQMSRYQTWFIEYQRQCIMFNRQPRAHLHPTAVAASMGVQYEPMIQPMMTMAAPIIAPPPPPEPARVVKRAAPNTWNNYDSNAGVALAQNFVAPQYRKAPLYKLPTYAANEDPEEGDGHDDDDDDDYQEDEDSDDSRRKGRRVGSGRPRGRPPGPSKVQSRGPGRPRKHYSDDDEDFSPVMKRARSGSGDYSKAAVRGRRAGYMAVLHAHVSGQLEATNGSREGSVEAAGMGNGHDAPRAPVRSGVPGFTIAEKIEDLPAEIIVNCLNHPGRFYLAEGKVVCECPRCLRVPPMNREFHPTHWEQHCGAGAAKKWKASIKIEPGGVPELPASAGQMPIGKYFDLRGVDVRPARTVGHPPAIDFTGGPQVKERPARHLSHEIIEAPDGPREVGLARRAALALKNETNKILGLTNHLYRRHPGHHRHHHHHHHPHHQSAVVPTWPPHEDVKYGNYKPIKVRWAGDHCCVCGSDVDYDCDQMVSCDACGITVHQSCYGVMELPGVNDIWLCRACELKEENQPDPQCCLCPVTGGALKPTTIPGLWCHAACMQWIPEVTCLNPARMEPIDRILNIQRERWELSCCVCKQRMGAKIQCAQCYTAFHPLCGRMAGFTMEMQESKEPGGGLSLVCMCPKHCKVKPHGSGITRVADEEDGEDGDGYGLYNCQPFPPLPAVPVPRCSAGCARAMPLDQTERAFHGTGAGCTTLKAFWMPEEPTAGSELYRLQQAAARARAKAKAKALSLMSEKRGRPKISRLRDTPRERITSDEPPAEVELTPLPEGVPDSVQVTCSGKIGVLMLRSQRVVYEGQEMSASRFEQICGKGDAKKWKTSLWAADANGEPECPMYEWLANHNLDRDFLTSLQANWAAYEAYRDWLDAQGLGDGEEDMPVPEEPQPPAGDAAAGTTAGLTAATAAPADALQGPATAAASDALPAVATGAVPADVSTGAQAAPANPASGGPVLGMAAATGDTAVPPTTASLPNGSTPEQPGSAGAENAVAEGTGAGAADGTPAGQEGAAGGAAAPTTPAAPAPDPIKMRLMRPEHVELDDVRQAFARRMRKQLGLPPLPPAPEPQPASLLPSIPGLTDSMLPVPLPVNTVVGAPQSGPPPAPLVLPPPMPLGFPQLSLESLPPPAPSPASVTNGSITANGLGSPAVLPAGPVNLGLFPPPAPVNPQVAWLAIPALPMGSAAATPEKVVGHCCRMFWPDDNEWYDADVVAYDPETKQHTLWYHADEVTESIDLATEDNEGRVQWLPVADAAHWPPAPPVRRPAPSRFDSVSQFAASTPSAAPQASNPQGTMHAPPARAPSQLSQQAGFASHRPPSRAPSILSQQQGQGPMPDPLAQPPRMHKPPIKVASSLSQLGRQASLAAAEHAAGMFQQYRSSTPGDLQGEQQLVDDLQRQQSEEQSAPAPTAPAVTAPGPATEQEHAREPSPDVPAAPPPPPKPAAPDVVDVICNGKRAEFLVRNMEVRTLEGVTMTGTEFERLAGKGAAKKWKVSIRICRPDGTPGLTIQDWLVEFGLEAPRTHKHATASLSKSNLTDTPVEGTRRRVATYKREEWDTSEGPVGPPPGRPAERERKPYEKRQPRVHKPGCTCIICTQGKGPSALAAHLAAAQAAGANVVATGPTVKAASSHPQRRAPQVRWGKRAYVMACPHLVCGVRRHKLWAIPQGKTWTEEEWESGVQERHAAIEAAKQQRKQEREQRRQERERRRAQRQREKEAREWLRQQQLLDAGMMLGEGEQEPVKEEPSASSSSESSIATSESDSDSDQEAGEKLQETGDKQQEAGGQVEQQAAQQTELPAEVKMEVDAAVAPEQPSQLAATDAAAAATAAAAAAVAAAQAALAQTTGVVGGDGMGLDGVKSEPGAELGASGALSLVLPGLGSNGAGTGLPGSGPAAQSKAVLAKALPAHHRLRQARVLERHRLTFGKSGVHGWGIFAVRDIPADMLLSEYRGVCVRPSVAEVMEKQYRASGKDCYFFKANEDAMVDSTNSGGWSRFTNHCCTPSMYTKVLMDDKGEPHIAFFSKLMIKAGQELTFDYRFREEEGASRVRCTCGAPNCKGFLN